MIYNVEWWTMWHTPEREAQETVEASSPSEALFFAKFNLPKLAQDVISGVDENVTDFETDSPTTIIKNWGNKWLVVYPKRSWKSFSNVWSEILNS